MNGDTWRLFRDGQVIGEFVVDGGDFPWLNAGFHPKEGFDQVRKLFKDDLRLLELAGPPPLPDYICPMNPWDRQVALALRDRIEHVTGRPWLDAIASQLHVSEFILHIEGNRAWWRWTDEPFERE